MISKKEFEYTVGRNLAKYRNEKKLTQMQVAEMAELVVVIHLHAAAPDWPVHEHRSAAAEHIYEARVVSRGKALYDPQEFALAADPRDKAFQTPSPPRKLIIEHSSPIIAASIPSRIRRRFLMVSYTSAAVSAK